MKIDFGGWISSSPSLTSRWIWLRGVNWRTLGIAAFRVNLGVAVAWSLLQFTNFRAFFHGYDFNIYRADALNAWLHGWGAYYTSGPGNVNPPLQGLIMFPILPFSPEVGYLLWTLLGLGCLSFVWWLAGEKRQWWQLPIMALLMPVVYTLALGQVVLVIAAIITLAWWLSKRQQGFTAGLVLSLATLKPQLILLLPPVLLLAGRRREFAGFVVGAVMIGLFSLGLVGVSGVEQVLANQHYELVHSQNYSVSPTMVLSIWFPGLLGIGLTIAAAILALGIAYKIRTVTAEPVFVVGILGSMLVAPFLHPQDLVLWIVVALLMMRSVGLPRGLAAAGVFFSWLPVLGVLFVSLAGLVVVLFRQQRDRPDRLTEAPRGA